MQVCIVNDYKFWISISDLKCKNLKSEIHNLKPGTRPKGGSPQDKSEI
jgi:hypothetical protein